MGICSHKFNNSFMLKYLFDFLEVKLAFMIDDRYLSSRDEAFVLTVSSDLQEFVDRHNLNLKM